MNFWCDVQKKQAKESWMCITALTTHKMSLLLLSRVILFNITMSLTDQGIHWSAHMTHFIYYVIQLLWLSAHAILCYNAWYFLAVNLFAGLCTKFANPVELTFTTCKFAHLHLHSSLSVHLIIIELCHSKSCFFPQTAPSVDMKYFQEKNEARSFTELRAWHIAMKYRASRQKNAGGIVTLHI